MVKFTVIDVEVVICRVVVILDVDIFQEKLLKRQFFKVNREKRFLLTKTT